MFRELSLHLEHLIVMRVMNKMISIVHVEDNLAHAVLVKQYFDMLDPQIEIIHLLDGEAALNYLLSRSVDVDLPSMVLLDLRLPKISGLEVLRRVREVGTLHALPMIVLSTSCSKDDIDNAYRYGANSYLVKPLDPESMRAMIQSIYNHWLSWNVVKE